ncbi:MAG: ATP-dependent zinc metalloprotease FtsH [Fuerstiella sp.]
MADPSGEKKSSGRPPARPDGGKPGEDPRRGSGFMTLTVIALVLIFFFIFFNSGPKRGVEVPYGFFWKQLKQDRNVASVEVHGELLSGKWKQIPQEGVPEDLQGSLKEEFHTVLLSQYAGDSELAAELAAQALEPGGLELNAERQTMSRGMEILTYLSVPLIFLFFLYIMMRRSSDPFSGGMMGGFIRSPARKFERSAEPVTYEDVAGLKTAKQDLEEVVQFLKNPKRFTKLGARIPKGVLLVGPPGTGKTLLARATAGEAGVPFFSINGSEFIQMFVGVGATRVRDLFKTAREASPCIIFIDEIDAVGRVRGAGVGGGHDEREQTLNQILSEMDGFEQTEAVIVIAATNRHDVLDPALLRPGRFDRHVTVDRPAREGRLGILKVHARKVPLADDVDLDELAKATIGYSGAELQKLVNEAALKAAREDKKKVEMEDFYYAEDLILMGARRDEHVDDEEKRLTAWHEAGHAVLAWYQEGMDPVHKVSIVPRGNTGGVTRLMPEKELPIVGRSALMKRLVMTMGGRAAEKLVFDEYSAGAAGDIAQATRIARNMVAHWGMSEKVGPVSFKQSEEHPFLGKEIHQAREFSDETARIIDIEVQDILKEANQTAIDMLTQFRDRLDALAEALLEHEDLESSRVREILGPRPGQPEESDNAGETGTPDAASNDSE